jgi:uncharacterized repeat protein (TIGR03833 family)
MLISSTPYCSGSSKSRGGSCRNRLELSSRVSRGMVRPKQRYMAAVAEVKTMKTELENDKFSLPKRSQIQPGMRVRVVEKQNQRSGLLTEGVVRRILTNSPTHPHGIKVMLEDGRVGRVQAILVP